MRTSCWNHSVSQRALTHPRRSAPHFTRASIRPVDAGSGYKHAAPSRKVAPAATSAPDRVLTEHADRSSETEKAFALLERAVSSSDAEQPRPASSKRATLESPEELASTSGHRTIVGSAMLLLGGIASQGLVGIHGSSEGACACAAIAAAYVLAGAPFSACLGSLHKSKNVAPSLAKQKVQRFLSNF